MTKVFAKIKLRIFGRAPTDHLFLCCLAHRCPHSRVDNKVTGIAPSSSVSIFVAALILGKAVLIADMLPAINLFPAKPLIHNVAWKTAIYLLVATLIPYLEWLVDFWRQAGGFIAGTERLLAEIVWPHFWAVQIILLVLILMYCTTRELVRVIGGDKARRTFFGPPPLPTY